MVRDDARAAAVLAALHAAALADVTRCQRLTARRRTGAQGLAIYILQTACDVPLARLSRITGQSRPWLRQRCSLIADRRESCADTEARLQRVASAVGLDVPW